MLPFGAPRAMLLNDAEICVISDSTVLPDETFDSITHGGQSIIISEIGSYDCCDGVSSDDGVLVEIESYDRCDGVSFDGGVPFKTGSDRRYDGVSSDGGVIVENLYNGIWVGASSGALSCTFISALTYDHVSSGASTPACR